jgi:hypothetical protein
MNRRTYLADYYLLIAIQLRVLMHMGQTPVQFCAKAWFVGKPDKCFCANPHLR